MNDSQAASLQGRLGGFVFRRVGSVLPSNVLENRLYSSPDTYVTLSPAEALALPPRQWRQYGEQRAGAYYGFTTPAGLRDNDAFSGSALFFHRAQRGDLDGVSFLIVPAPVDVVAVPPRPGDLLCGVPSPPSAGKKSPSFLSWFVCSEQFYRAWTLVMFSSHDSFALAEKKACGPRAYWMSGNRLMTNSYRKWMQTCRAEARVPEEKDRHFRYWRTRTEGPSNSWVHLYCALVLVARFRERPSESNVPRNRGSVSTAVWDLPSDYVRRLLAAFSSGDPDRETREEMGS